MSGYIQYDKNKYISESIASFAASFEGRAVMYIDAIKCIIGQENLMPQRQGYGEIYIIKRVLSEDMRIS